MHLHSPMQATDKQDRRNGEGKRTYDEGGRSTSPDSRPRRPGRWRERHADGGLGARRGGLGFAGFQGKETPRRTGKKNREGGARVVSQRPKKKGTGAPPTAYDMVWSQTSCGMAVAVVLQHFVGDSS